MKKAHLSTGIFWYWNADPTPGGIRQQLRTIRKAGFDCVYLHPMPDSFHKQNFFQGMTVSYLGEKYFRLAAVKTYLDLGWKPWLYLDDMEGRWRALAEKFNRSFDSLGCLPQETSFPDKKS